MARQNFFFGPLLKKMPITVLYNGYPVFPGGKAAGAWR